MTWAKYEPFFRPSEFVCRCGCGLLNVWPELLDRLLLARKAAAFPFIITSGSRCRLHNQAVGGSPTSAHLDGMAADIWCVDMFARGRLVKLLSEAGGFMRFGLHPRFVHVDIDLTRPWGIYLY
jgi:uncharacterized protein YcbK (DUF882 family)